MLARLSFCFTKAAIIFRQSIPGLGLSIEQATDNVPADGRFHVIDQGAIQRGYQSLRPAVALYDRLLVMRRGDAAAMQGSDAQSAML